ISVNKYLGFMLCIFLCAVFLAGCGQPGSEQGWEPTDYITVNNLEGVTMTVREETVSSTGLTLAFVNNSDQQCIYGEHYVLEKKINQGWYQVPVVVEGDYGFDDIGYDLAPDEEKEWDVDWEWLYGSLDAGDYRIVKDILDFRVAGDYDTYSLAVEFTTK
ncbi:MAG: immunoglobulin-like domain-containing protein, partial [Dethiobacteria bacterium]|nr:immunoglobulin-like domain-containing protein [Dethiobacteria bacterium]